MKRWIALGFGLAGLAATPAHAEDDVFGYTYAAETAPKGETEMELWATDRRGKDAGHYDAQDYRLEVEHGFSDRFTAAIYANFAGQHIRGLEPDFRRVHRAFAFQGLSAEFRYNVLNVDKEGFGLTLYAEPGWSRIRQLEGDKDTEYELELKAIVQKNFLKDRLIWAANFTIEPEWEHDREADEAAGKRDWEKELKAELTTGLSYRVAPRWYAGVEGRYASVYPNWTSGLNREAYAVSAGPTIHYDAKKWSATLTYLPQLFGSPSPDGSRALGEYEKRELRLKIGFEF